jgi:hypothetical protein
VHRKNILSGISLRTQNPAREDSRKQYGLPLDWCINIELHINSITGCSVLYAAVELMKAVIDDGIVDGTVMMSSNSG